MISSNSVTRKSFIAATLVLGLSSTALSAKPSGDPNSPATKAAPLVSTVSASEASLELQSALTQLETQLNLERLPDAEASKQQLAEALQQLDQFIVIDSDNGQLWSRFLRLDELREQLDGDPTGGVLADLESNMRQNYNGLELKQFINLRNAIGKYRNALRYGSRGQKTLDFIQNQRTRLLEQLAESPELDADKVTIASGLLAFLTDSNQAPDARLAIASAFNSPNLELQVSEQFVNSLVGRTVAQPRDVNECLLGTRIIGDACLAGDVSVDISPMQNGISMSIDLLGTMTTNNRGYNRGVVLHSTGFSPIWASKQVWATTEFVSASPATVSNNLRTQINAIQHRLRIVRRIAKKKAAEQKPKADAIARGRLSKRVATGYDEEVDGQLATANARLRKFNQPTPAVERLGMTKPTFSLASSSNAVSASATQAAPDQLAAPEPCPLATPTDYGLNIRIHQSLPVNLLDSLLVDRVLRSNQLDDYVLQFADEVPKELVEESQKENWQVYFRSFRPVDIRFENGQITLAISTTKLIGNRSVEKPATIKATFTPAIDSGQVKLVRDGELDIDIGGGGTQGTALRSVVRAKFDSILKPEIVLPIDQLKKQYPKTANLVISQINADHGWLQISLK